MTAWYRKPKQRGRVRVGVLGAGAWAEFAHLPGYKRDARCELVAIADPVLERAEAFAEKFGIPNVYDSHQALIAREDIDLVDVCTPSATHFELAWAALEAGKRVLVSAHGNSLRGIIKYLSDIGDDEIVGLEIPTGKPIVYDLNDDMSVVRRYYLEDA